MTSPVLVPKEPRHRKKRSSLKRQRLVTLIALGVVVLLAVAFAIVYHFTSRIVFSDIDGTKYYVVKQDGVYVMEDADGNPLSVTEDGNFLTAIGTIVMVDSDTGKPQKIAVVYPVGTEVHNFNANSGTFEILMYPLLERANIRSIRLVNEKGELLFSYNEEKDDFEIRGYEDYNYDEIMFASLVVATGYSTTYMRIDAQKVQQYGYAEYGLPEDGEAAKVYFEITDRSGNTHKVILGNKNPAGSGFYARYEGRAEVYVLKETAATQYSAAFSTAIGGGIEQYLQPLITTPMNSGNYFDVTDFKINKLQQITDEMLKDPSFKPSSLMTNVITFSFSPIDLRKGTYYVSQPYLGSGAYKDFPINSLKVDDCLQNLMDMQAKRIVKVFAGEDSSQGLFEFFRECGVAYSIEYTSNLEREGADGNYAVKESAYQQLWISPITEEGTYYVYNEAFEMIVEVSRQYLEYLEWSAFGWIEDNIFSGSIAFLQEMSFNVPGHDAVAGLTAQQIKFIFDNSASITKEDGSVSSSAIPSTKNLKVWANDAAISDVMQVKRFYEMLLHVSLSGMASCSEAQQQAFREAAKSEDHSKDGISPFLVINMTYSIMPDGSGGYKNLTYCFYKYGAGSQCFVTVNGEGSFYMLQDYAEKITEDLGRIFTGDTIIPDGKP